VCAPDDGWRYHRKHVEQFPDKISFVTLHLVGYILKYKVKFFFSLREMKVCGGVEIQLQYVEE